MSTAIESAQLTAAFAALLRGEPVPWSSLGVDADGFLAACADADLTGLVHRRVSDNTNVQAWPASVRGELGRRARLEAAAELVRREEATFVLDALARESIRPILIKGTPLAYTLYDAPSLRPRCDTDFLIPHSALEGTRRVMAAIGYTAPAYCDDLFCQCELVRHDLLGFLHVCDFHWKISTQSVFSDVLTYEEVAAGAVAVPALGRHARAAAPLQALLLACIHPVMHHRNAERLIWIYDVHLLASRLSPAELDRFATFAAAKGVAAICGYELGLARSRFGTGIPSPVTARLEATRAAEPTAAYLRTGRRWHDELISNVRGLARWADRLHLLREVVLPKPGYMLRSYRFEGWLGVALLPALYVHRAVRGIWRVLRGAK